MLLVSFFGFGFVIGMLFVVFVMCVWGCCGGYLFGVLFGFVVGFIVVFGIFVLLFLLFCVGCFIVGFYGFYV